MKHIIDSEMDSILFDGERATHVGELEKLANRIRCLWMEKLNDKQARRLELITCAINMRTQLMEIELICHRFDKLIRDLQ